MDRNSPYYKQVQLLLRVLPFFGGSESADITAHLFIVGKW